MNARPSTNAIEEYDIVASSGSAMIAIDTRKSLGSWGVSIVTRLGGNEGASGSSHVLEGSLDAGCD